MNELLQKVLIDTQARDVKKLPVMAANAGDNFVAWESGLAE